MKNSREYCIKCNLIRDMLITESKRKELSADGNEKEILTKSYHCQACHTFIKSEDIDDEPKE